MIIYGDAVSYPGTMMVHFEYTFAANTAVMGSRRFNKLTFLAVPEIHHMLSEVREIFKLAILVEQSFRNSIFSVIKSFIYGIHINFGILWWRIRAVLYRVLDVSLSMSCGTLFQNTCTIFLHQIHFYLSVIQKASRFNVTILSWSSLFDYSITSEGVLAWFHYALVYEILFHNYGKDVSHNIFTTYEGLIETIFF